MSKVKTPPYPNWRMFFLDWGDYSHPPLLLSLSPARDSCNDSWYSDNSHFFHHCKIKSQFELKGTSIQKTSARSSIFLCNYGSTYWKLWLEYIWKQSKSPCGKAKNMYEIKQVQPVWFCIHSGRQFEDTFENAQWHKVKQVLPVWLCICSGRRFEDTFENTDWEKFEQMQPVWLCILSGKLFEDPFENWH